MRLPQDKKERTKVLVLIGFGAVGVVYGIYAGVIRPLLSKRTECRTRIEELQGSLATAETTVSRMKRGEKENLEALREIVKSANRKGYVLRPRLGNYLLVATEIVERHANAVGVTVASLREVGILKFPQDAKDDEKYPFSSYAMRLGLECGLHDLIRFVEALEASNPYLCLASITITAQDKKPDRHDVSVEVHWPVWSDSEMPGDLEEQLRDALETARTKSTDDTPNGEDDEAQEEMDQ